MKTINKRKASTPLKCMSQPKLHTLGAYISQDSVEGPASVFVSFDESHFIHFVNKPKEVGTLREEFNKKLNIKTSYHTTVLDIVQKVIAFTQPIILKGKLFYAPCTKKNVAILKT